MPLSSKCPPSSLTSKFYIYIGTSPCLKSLGECLLEYFTIIIVVGYRMVGHFRKGFIFVFFTSQEPFMKIKTMNFFVLHVQSKWTVFQLVLHGIIYIATNRTVSVSAPLTAIPDAIQEIEVLCKHRHTNQTAVPRAEAIISINILGMRLLSSPRWNKALRLPYLFLNNSRHSHSG